MLEEKLEKTKEQGKDKKSSKLEKKISKKQEKIANLESKRSKIQESLELVNDKNDRYMKLSNKIDKVIEKFVKKTEKFSDNPDKLAKINEKFSNKFDELKIKFSSEIDRELESKLGERYSELTSDERQEMIDTIISEKFKVPLQEKFESDMITSESEISVLGFELLPSAYAACSTQPVVTKFKQLKVDINGQPGFEGDNDLETVKKQKLSSCLTKYTLTFADEDHPIPHVDANYDIYRLYEYGRIQDIESFYVSNGKVWFLDSGSKSQSFWILTVPIHHQDINNFSDTVYVSNTWNHMMDTSNTNSGAPLKTWYK